MYLGTSGECVEKCGDGFNYGLNECDDGNTLNGDGCSSTCAVESDYVCTGGSYTSSDTCKPVKTEIFSI